jgi:hypothetical protein
MPAGRGFVRRVTLESLPMFAPLLRQPGQPAAEEQSGADAAHSEEVESSLPQDSPPDDSLRTALDLFSGESIRVPQTHHRPARARSTPNRPGSTRAAAPAATPSLPTSPAIVPGSLVWRKTRLPASDVQRQQGNPTGGLRLTQARFAGPGGETIDQTTYFRQELFGFLPWRGIRSNPYVEATDVPFQCELCSWARILGSEACWSVTSQAGKLASTTTQQFFIGETWRTQYDK